MKESSGIFQHTSGVNLNTSTVKKLPVRKAENET